MTEVSLVAKIRMRYRQIRAEIDAAARRAGRDETDVKLLVVTKKQPVPTVQAVIDAGIDILGENYPEEAVHKREVLRGENKVEWHMIGHVQSRKARLVAENFALVHSLDNLKLAHRLNRFASAAGVTLPVLLEFNVSGEESKFGWAAFDETRWDELFPDVEAILALENLALCGLMTMPPLFRDAELTRPHFRRLRLLRDYLAKHYPQGEWDELSMGTSGDFKVAVEEGATYVRVGQAIVGPRL